MFGVGGPVRARARTFLKSYARYRPREVERRLLALRTLGERADPGLFASQDLTRYELSVFSQNGEDGVLVEILNRIGTAHHFFVEFGIQDGTEGNCVFLADALGWSGLFIEGDPDLARLVHAKYADTPVKVRRAMVHPDTLPEILAAEEVPQELDILSIDIDGNDVYVWDALDGWRPRVVIVEYNPTLPVDEPVAQPFDRDHQWDGSSNAGCSLAALEVVAARKGYRLAHTELTGTNAFFVRDDLWDSLAITRAPRRTQNLGLTGLRTVPEAPSGGWQQFS